jgi:alkanesulfonate monooxygenase SsuD/methylene tetrahydromethanopterin reductase-like flavin-dependent oxidoreductase (luciferase family)
VDDERCQLVSIVLTNVLNTHHTTRQASSSERSQAVIGLTLVHEQFPNTQLVEFGVQAEQAGFAAVWADDHFEPWKDNPVRIVLDFSCRGSV